MSKIVYRVDIRKVSEYSLLHRELRCPFSLHAWIVVSHATLTLYRSVSSSEAGRMVCILLSTMLATRDVGERQTVVSER